MASISKVISKGSRCTTLPECYTRPEPRRPWLSEVGCDDNVTRPTVGDTADGVQVRSQGSFQVIDHGDCAPVISWDEVVEKKEKVAEDFSKSSMEDDNPKLHHQPLDKHVVDWPANPTTFQLLGKTIRVNSDLGLGYNYGEKDCMPESQNNLIPSFSMLRLFGKTIRVNSDLGLGYNDGEKDCVPESQNNLIPSSSMLRLFGKTIRVNSDLGLGYNYGEKDCMPESILPSDAVPTSTSFKRKRPDSTPAPPFFPSLSKSPSFGEKVYEPTTSVNSGQKMKASAQSLLPQQEEGRWKIRKKLCQSDLGNNCRLLIPKKDARAHIMCFMDNKNEEAIESTNGMEVRVVDMDKDITKHNLVFKYLHSLKGYILRKGWKQEFVKKKELQVGDEVGLYWDSVSKKFYFSVLHRRAINRHPQA